MLNYENVKLWFAKNNERVVTIDEVNEENKNNTYMCPVCGSNLKPKAINSKRVTPHFAHVDSSKCNSESQIHFWFKHKFLGKGDKFTVTADATKDYICKEILVEQEYKAGDLTYRPDVTVLTECGETIYFEMAFSNKKKVKDYLDIWLELRSIVVEVDINQLMLKSIIPTFKSLFYEGKCFNTKRSDTYYNTIGKYKEKKHYDEISCDLKERIRKLDWFWDDIFRYKKNEIDIENMSSAIDNIHEKDREIALSILSKKSCNEIYKDYLSFKQGSIYKELQDKYGISHEYYSITKSGFTNSWHDKYPTKNIEFRDLKEKEIRGLDIRRYSKNEIIEEINRMIASVNKRHIFQEKLKYAKENLTLMNTISKINEECKKVDANYCFHDSFSYSTTKVGFHYNCDYKLHIETPDEIIYSNNEKMIYDFYMEKIQYYMSTVEPFENLESIIRVLDSIKQGYNSVVFQKHLKNYTEKVRRKTYKSYSKLEEVKYVIEYRVKAEDLILFKIEKRQDDKFTGYENVFEYAIYKNKIYKIKTYDHSPASIEKQTLICTLNKNLSNLKEALQKIINNEIQYNLICNCIDCKDDYTIDSGEISFFVKNELNIPKRCKECRQKRRKNKNRGNEGGNK